jgi:predicted heme/steroid binding protein
MAVTGSALAILRYLETGSIFSGTFGSVFIIKLALFGLMVLLALIATAVLTRRLSKVARHPGAAFSGPEEVTPETLPSFDGHDGNQALVAVSGQLYDVTNSRLWKDGVHVRQHRAGQDLTEAMDRAPHGAEVLERVPAVGTIRAAPAKTGPRPPRARRVLLLFTYANLVLTFGILLCVAWWKWGFSWEAGLPARGAPVVAAVSEASSACIECHIAEELMRSQIAEWERGAHARERVGCYECHRAEAGDPDAMEHNGYTISVLVTPNDCAAPGLPGQHPGRKGGRPGCCDPGLPAVPWRSRGGPVRRKPVARELAEYRHWPHQPRRQQGLLFDVPYATPL